MQPASRHRRLLDAPDRDLRPAITCRRRYRDISFYLRHGRLSRDAEDHMTTGPDLRIGDADREAAAARLREHYAQGRLTLEEFNQRLDAVFAATTQSQLSALTRDLPHVGAPAAALRPGAGAAATRENERC